MSKLYQAKGETFFWDTVYSIVSSLVQMQKLWYLGKIVQDSNVVAIW